MKNLLLKTLINFGQKYSINITLIKKINRRFFTNILNKVYAKTIVEPGKEEPIVKCNQTLDEENFQALRDAGVKIRVVDDPGDKSQD